MKSFCTIYKANYFYSQYKCSSTYTAIESNFEYENQAFYSLQKVYITTHWFLKITQTVFQLFQFFQFVDVTLKYKESSG